MFKVKLTLIAFALVAVAAAQLYLKGMDDGIANIDQEAFDSYVYFAKQMKEEHRHGRVASAKVRDQMRREYVENNSHSVWAAFDGKGK